ncbi:MAG TPA: hypothetical protein DD723_00195 [Candidatus Omnitrophica bacterium]|nr:hypothetical protein [Candidatus Omnitrophota bacterium]
MRKLRTIFNDWGNRTQRTYIHKQWVLSKWEVLDGIDWPVEKVKLLFQNIRDGLKPARFHSLIDIGCGGGWIQKGLKPYVKQTAGLDISLEMLRNAHLVSPRKTNLICGNVCELPLRDKSFDRILCYFVFINFGDPKDIIKAILEIIRILKNGGRALIGQIPDRNFSSQYDTAKKEYLEYCRKNFQVGKNIRDICLVPVHPLDRKFFTAFLEKFNIPYEIRNSFNPFYRAGEPETVEWRFDLILQKKK